MGDNGRVRSRSDDQTPLLRDEGRDGSASSYGTAEDSCSGDKSKARVTSLPKGQIALLAYMRMATPLVDSQSLPVCYGTSYTMSTLLTCMKLQYINEVFCTLVSDEVSS